MLAYAYWAAGHGASNWAKVMVGDESMGYTARTVVGVFGWL